MENLITNFNKELIEVLAQGVDVTEIFRCQPEDAMNLLLEGKYGILHLKMPMDRKGLFSQKPLSFFNESNSTLEDNIKLFHQNGLTTRDLLEMIEKIYGQQTVSNSSKSTLEEL